MRKRPLRGTPRRVVVYGAGGHGKVVAELVVLSELKLEGILDDGQPAGMKVGGATVLGGFEWLSGAAAKGVVVALGIGDNASRKRVAVRCLEGGVGLLTVVHPSAVVSASASLGQGTVVMAGAIINPDAQLGVGTIVNSGAVVDHDCVLAPYSHVSPGAAMGGAAKLGVCSHLGLGVVVLPGVSVGDGTTVGAGAVVVADLPDRVIAVGVPARVTRSKGDLK